MYSGIKIPGIFSGFQCQLTAGGEERGKSAKSCQVYPTAPGSGNPTNTLHLHLPNLPSRLSSPYLPEAFLRHAFLQPRFLSPQLYLTTGSGIWIALAIWHDVTAKGFQTFLTFFLLDLLRLQVL